MSPVGTGAGTGFLDQKIDFRLGQLVNTIFATDKDVYFGNVLIVRCVFQSNKVGFLSTSNVNPTLGALPLVSGATTAAAASGIANTCVYLSGLWPVFGVRGAQGCAGEDDEAAEQRRRHRHDRAVGRDGERHAHRHFGYAVIQARLGARHVSTSKRLMVCSTRPSPAAQRSTTPTCRRARAANPMGREVTTFHTEIDANRNQDMDLNAVMTPQVGQPNDYLEQKRQLKGSVIEGRHQFYQNWHFCDNFCNENPADGMAPSDTVASST